jgi:hypothetical protein
VDAKEHVLQVKGLLLTKKFNLGTSCTYALLGSEAGGADSLRPGQQVKVGYANASGVLVASRVEQLPRYFHGTVKSLDAGQHQLVLDRAGPDKPLRIAADCAVVLRGGRSGTLADVQPGHRVTVLYETPADGTVVHEIKQTSAAFTGTLTAIDLTERTLKARGTFASKKFSVGAGCAILLDGQPAELGGLKPGDKLEFSYDDVDGVNVLNRIVESESRGVASESVAAQSVRSP